MFDPKDNFPDFWPKNCKDNLQIDRLEYFEYRRRLIKIIKFATIEILNSPKDFDQIVDEWLSLENSERNS